MARVRTRNRAEENDLVERTLLMAAARSDEFAPGTNAKAWMLDFQRTAHRAGWCHKARLASANGRSCLHTALLRLPDDLREAVFLCDGAHCGFAEIAKILGCDVTTAKARVEEARCRLAKLIDWLEQIERRHDRCVQRVRRAANAAIGDQLVV